MSISSATCEKEKKNTISFHVGFLVLRSPRDESFDDIAQTIAQTIAQANVLKAKHLPSAKIQSSCQPWPVE